MVQAAPGRHIPSNSGLFAVQGSDPGAADDHVRRGDPEAQEAPLAANTDVRPVRPRRRRPGMRGVSVDSAGRLSNIVYSDQAAINQAIELHLDRSRPWPPIIWDCTYETGKMWRGLDVQPIIRTDIAPKAPGVLQLDYRELHRDWRGDGGVDMLVFDPPHAMHGGKKGGMAEGGWGDSYGTRTAVATKTRELSIAWTFADFLLSARHVLDEHGIILCKLGDQTHGARNQWEHCRMWSAALACGFTPCDMMIKIRKEPKRRDPKHKHQYHLDKIICYFLVIRAGSDNC